ncbi:MAG TPA: 23S rRNA (adenine(2503)-C(2))-methyltransferase RlmN, partial [Limnochordia bacterium]|nr:23S rRNA (adenine(2503)-C(2))-methyltransferase RlmN [Limnochordia bacterium]
RRTACISSQVGCAMGCTFCATAIGGLERNLQTGEITAQVLAINHDLAGQGLGPLTNVVFMGMGEPLANYARVVAAIRLINEGVGIGQRHITLSTSGLAPQIRKLADEGLQITLALSLHQVTDAERELTMPITKRYPIAELMEACRDYVRTTGRRVSFEYALMAGENDSPEHAQKLADLAAPLGAHVNLIPLNPVRGAGHQRPTDAAVSRFRNLLEAEGVAASVRRSRGLDIDAACGQLRRRVEQEAPDEPGKASAPLGGEPTECPS